MQLLKMPGRSAAIILVFIMHTLAYTIDDSFDVQDSCTPDQRKLLNQFVTETLELIDTSLVGIENFKIGKDDDEIMGQNLLMYFNAKKTQANRDPNTVLSEYLLADRERSELCAFRWVSGLITISRHVKEYLKLQS